MVPIVVESVLRRQLGITFIDARSMVTKAKLNLNILGYPSEEERDLIIEEALRIYDSEYSGIQRFEMINNCDSLYRAIRRQSAGPVLMTSRKAAEARSSKPAPPIDTLSISSSSPSLREYSRSFGGLQRRRGSAASTKSVPTPLSIESPTTTTTSGGTKRRRRIKRRRRHVLFTGDA